MALYDKLVVAHRRRPASRYLTRNQLRSAYEKLLYADNPATRDLAILRLRMLDPNPKLDTPLEESTLRASESP